MMMTMSWALEISPEWVPTAPELSWLALKLEGDWNHSARTANGSRELLLQLHVL